MALVPVRLVTIYWNYKSKNSYIRKREVLRTEHVYIVALYYWGTRLWPDIMKEIKFYVRHCFKDVKPSTWRWGTEENEKNKMCAKNKEEHQ